MWKLIAAGLLSLFASRSWGAWNEPHVEGTQEHPLLKFCPQASVYQFDQKDFDSADIITAYKKLSEDRAAAVKAWLVRNGAREGSLSTAGFGDTQPLADNKTDDGRAKNRRVELVKQ